MRVRAILLSILVVGLALLVGRLMLDNGWAVQAARQLPADSGSNSPPVVKGLAQLAYGETLTVTEAYTIHLPLLAKRWPPFPDTPVLNPINNADGDGNYDVNWNAAFLAETYVLEEDENPAFNSPTTRYNGPGTSWVASNKPPGPYYYRVKANNSWGPSSWSSIQSVTVGSHFFDNFSNSGSGWNVDDAGTAKWSYQSGEYEILLRKQNVYAGATAPLEGLVTYNVEADMRLRTGSDGLYGLIFDFLDRDNFYYLVVHPGEGWYGLAKINKGNPELLVSSTYDSIINLNSASNHLEVLRQGSQINLTINGKLVKSLNNTGFGGDLRVGLYAEAWSSDPLAARYDNFEVWYLGMTRGLMPGERLAEPLAADWPGTVLHEFMGPAR